MENGLTTNTVALPSEGPYTFSCSKRLASSFPQSFPAAAGGADISLLVTFSNSLGLHGPSMGMLD